MSKCSGCGITLQDKDDKAVGYTPSINNKLCQRCFKIKNYNLKDDIKSIYSNEEICSYINKKHYFTFFLCDFPSLNQKVIDLYCKINKPKILVITKIDILPKNIKLVNLKERIKKIYGVSEVLFTSVKYENTKSDILYYINSYKKVIFAGLSSCGKSSLLNFLGNFDITTSRYKNTTSDFITLKLDDNILIDTPGFKNDSLIMKTNKLLIKTIYLKKGYELLINNHIIQTMEDINLAIYFYEKVAVQTRKIKEKFTYKVKILAYQDLLIDNLCFIYFKNTAELMIDKNYELRPSLVGGMHE